ncbi:MAG: hypothetical protein MJA84_14400 [Firmicutes bacterium]|nr:hypothetical protein [Bacillota bacterium]
MINNPNIYSLLKSTIDMSFIAQRKAYSNVNSSNNFTDNQKNTLSVAKIQDNKIQSYDIKKLNAYNNSLLFKEDYYYILQPKCGRTVVLKSDINGHVYMPFTELNIDNNCFLPSDYREIQKIEKFFTYLSRDKSAYLIRSNYAKAETKKMLAEVGIEPGWFKIENGTKSNRFYMLDDGTIYPEYQVEATRNFFNNYNLFKSGYTKDSVFIIDGKEYKLDSNGHLNVPKGTACVFEKIKIIKN